jgi:translocator protein
MSEIADHQSAKRAVGTASVAVPVIVGLGFLIGWLSNSGYGNPWFDKLAKPAAMPPGWAFGVTWTILYILMGLALALIVGADSHRRRGAILLFLAQLVLNYSWSPIFFGFQHIEIGLAVILAVLLITGATAIAFAKIRPLAGWLLAPYLVWLSFATFLNFEIWRLNSPA